MLLFIKGFDMIWEIWVGILRLWLILYWIVMIMVWICGDGWWCDWV